MQNQTKKIRVAVLYGGRSGEHEISLQSAASVVRNLDPNYFDVVPIGIDKQGHWILNDIKQISLDANTKALPIQTKTHALLSSPGQLTTQQQNALMVSNNLEASGLFDVVFPVLHGPLGEDGTVQGIFELADIPYVGPNVLASAIVMDKDIAKRLISAAGLAVAPYLAIKTGGWQADPEYYINTINAQLGCPVFVKPANLGSSVGIHKVKKVEDLKSAIDDAFLYDQKILVEKALNAREIELAVLENSNFGSDSLVSIPGEVVPNHEFYSYAAKYLDEHGAELLIPAPLTPEQITDAQMMARNIFTALECEGMARIDLFMEKDTGKFYFNEANTIPGFTSISMYPKLWEATGIPYSELLTRLIQLAVARQSRKHNLKREWAIPGSAS